MDRIQIKVRVPATTANLGPGFDCLGMALDLWNEVQVVVGDGPTLSRSDSLCTLSIVSIEGQGAGELPLDRRNLVYQAMEHLFKEVHLGLPELRLHCRNGIPLERGLGSSAAAIVGGLVAANFLLSKVSRHEATLPSAKLLDMAVRLEGHPDNAAAALLGGIQLIVQEEDALLSAPVSVPDNVHAVLFIPEMTIATDEARKVLPRSYSREDAVYNMGRVGLLVNALATGRLDDLRYATGDRVHQPYRQRRLFPAMKVIFAAAMKAGALGVFLSGSGSTILALARGHEMTVAYEMAEAARQASVAGEVKITRPTPLGAHVVEAGQ